MQNLVSVDIANSGDHVLAEKEWFYGSAFSLQATSKNSAVEMLTDGINAKPDEFWQHLCRVYRVEHHDFAEGTRVNEPHFVTYAISRRQ